MRPTGSSTAGWARADCQTATWLIGAEVYGDALCGGIAGLGCTESPSRLSYLPHFRSTERWYTGIATLNPHSEVEAQVTFTGWMDDGTPLGKVHRTIQPGTTLCEVSESLLSAQGQGWIQVDSDEPVIVMEIFGNKVDGGIAGVSACEPATEFIVPHVVVGEGVGSGLALANPGEETTWAKATLYDRAGDVLGIWGGEIPSKARKVQTFKSLFPQAGVVNGWARVTTSRPVVSLATMSCLTTRLRGELAAIVPVQPRELSRLPVLVHDMSWSTYLVLVNPTSAFATLGVDAYDEEGGRLGSRQLLLGPNEKYIGLAASLLDLPCPIRGWVEVRSDVPTAAILFLRLQETSEGWGLAGIEPVNAGPVVYYPHVTSTPRWWTQLWMGHPLQGSLARGELFYRDSDGIRLGYTHFNMSRRGGMVMDAGDLLP